MKSSLRIMGVLILTVLLAVFLTVCSGGGGGGGDGDSGSTINNGLSSVAFASVIVKDASGQNLGYFIGDQHPWRYFLIYSPSGYMYWIDWAGSLIDTSDDIYFSELDCKGTLYSDMGYADKGIYGKIVTYDKFHDKLYRLKSSLITAGYIKGISITVKSEYLHSDGTCENTTNPYTSGVIELEETTRADVGIPATITAPITLDFQ